eukprot:scaffold199924_cov19-Prasinocladus_malaysianus.AAC.1
MGRVPVRVIVGGLYKFVLTVLLVQITASLLVIVSSIVLGNRQNSAYNRTSYDARYARICFICGNALVTIDALHDAWRTFCWRAISARPIIVKVKRLLKFLSIRTSSVFVAIGSMAGRVWGSQSGADLNG